MGKGEIARDEQFLLFPQCFPHCFLTIRITFSHVYQILNYRLLTLTVWKSLRFVVWERVNPFPNKPWFLPVCNTSLMKTLWEKDILVITVIITIFRGRARNEQFLIFLQCFLPLRRTICHIHQIQNYRLQTLSLWESVKVVVRGRVKCEN